MKTRPFPFSRPQREAACVVWAAVERLPRVADRSVGGPPQLIRIRKRRNEDQLPLRLFPVSSLKPAWIAL